MAKYRGKNKNHREMHPKIFVWSHTERAEIEYFQDFKNYLKTPLLMPKRDILWTPQELLEKIVEWKKANIYEDDNDQVWCIFDVDDFYKKEKDRNDLLKAIKNAMNNNIKIAYTNECFELWILLHFEVPTGAVLRGNDMEKKIQQVFKKNGAGEFKKNQKIFQTLLPFQAQAIKNAQKLLSNYENIDWNKVLSEKGNPSTSIHFLIKEINRLIGNIKK